MIARIDDRDYRIALDRARAQVANGAASIQNIDAQISVQKAQISANQAQLDQAQAALVFAQQQDARMYPPGAEVGTSEVITGRWLSRKRSRFILATKGGGKMGPAAWDAGNSRKHLLDAIDASLRRLKVDYIDLYQLHLDDPATPLDEMVEAMDTIVRSGKARYIGVSNFLAYRLARALGRQDALTLTRFVSAQPRYNLLFRECERELLPLATSGLVPGARAP
ncbi:aldo/keto reductase [Bradyrhizobium sp. Tv2a-2]|uniref:aldo/keto reductase n=1 Tax=Bradyrhizobium sp. Tv2a-2 TaxID=113395 RepID=UPI00040EADB6|nr:aldo/keto reductase [Bradyrhizobium sp. Tv2a-2]